MQVSHYLWPQDSAIEQMDVSELASGRLEARLYAGAGQQQGSLALIPHQLKQAGYTVINDSDGQGRHFLRVAGFKDADELLGVMEREAMIPPPAQQQRSGEKEKQSFTGMVRDKAMNVAGVFAVMGHLSLLMSGFLLKDKSMQAAGATFATTNALAAWRGTGKKGGEVERIAGEAFDALHLKAMDIPDPRTASVQELAKEGGLVQKVWDTVAKKPVDFVLNERPYETGQVASMLANAYLARGDKNAQKNIPMRINALASLTGGLTLAFVPPKPHNAKGQEEAPSGPFGKVKSFLQDNNTGVGAFFMTISNVAAAMAAKEAFATRGKADAAQKAGKGYEAGGKSFGVPSAKDVKNRHAVAYLATATAACWFLAGGITALGSKKRGRDYEDPEVAEHVSAICADVLLKTPEGMRNKVIDDMATYLGKHKEIAFTKDEMVTSIQHKLKALDDSPWQQKISAQKANVNMAPQQSASLST